MGEVIGIYSSAVGGNRETPRENTVEISKISNYIHIYVNVEFF